MIIYFRIYLSIHTLDPQSSTSTKMRPIIARLAVLVVPAAHAAPPLWPQPFAYTNGTGVVTVAPTEGGADFFVLDSDDECATLTTAFSRYAGLTFPHPASAPSKATRAQAAAQAGAISSLTVKVVSLDESFPALATDESYTLSVPSDGGAAAATLSAATIYGALRGLETFSQLVVFDFETRTYEVAGAPLIIEDAPRFAHRGLMVDSARHFLPLATLERAVDAMAYAKLNVLHWHMVDTQSFPFEVAAVPALWAGAFSARERYLQEEVSGLVEYARQRGVRVVVEFDVPGHAASWCAGRPDVCPSSTCLGEFLRFFSFEFVAGPSLSRTESMPHATLHNPPLFIYSFIYIISSSSLLLRRTLKRRIERDL